MNKVYEVVTKELIDCKLKANTRGFYYLRDILILLLSGKALSFNFKRDVYPTLTYKYNRTQSAIEKSISLCVDRFVLKMDMSRLEDNLSAMTDFRSGKLKNKLFIMNLYNKLVYEIQ